MIILAHRGFWTKGAVANSIESFYQAWDSGFGIETDIRDFNGQLVISHDPAKNTNVLTVEKFFREYKIRGKETWLALNIKADGLAADLEILLKRYSVENYFLFDMSFPQHLQFSKKSLKTFSRISEFEKEAYNLPGEFGLWIDMFNGDWVSSESLMKLQKEKPNAYLALVSPELHKRPYKEYWQDLKKSGLPKNIMLCTDYPHEAEVVFKG